MQGAQTISILNFVTHKGASYKSIDLHFQHFGMQWDKAPVILVNHSLTGDSNVCGPSGWWNEVIGPGLTIDTNKFAILAFNIPGNGFYNQTFEHPEDFHAGDIATLFKLGLDQLGISELYALIGGSIGGGIAWEMAAQFPNLTQRLVPVAADWKASDWIIANTFLQKRILENSKEPLRDARIHAMLCYRNPESLESRFNRSFNEERNCYNVESWLHYHGDKLEQRFALQAYKMVNHLLGTIDITRGQKDFTTVVSSIKADIHLIAIDSDLFFTPLQDQKTYALIKPFKDNIFFHEIASLHGHDAFLIENEKVKHLLTKIFNHPIKHSNYESSTRTY